jgi:hypothetical protein
VDRLRILLVAAIVTLASPALGQTLGGQQLGNLPPATTPLDPTDLLYVVQGGASRSVQASHLVINTTITVNGVSCVLGSTCTVTAVANSLAVGTPLTGGTSGHILYDNAGAVGELNKTGAGAVVLANGPTLGGLVTLTGNLTGPLTTWTDTQTCSAGEITWDASYLYVCTATNTVKRAALSTF